MGLRRVLLCRILMVMIFSDLKYEESYFGPTQILETLIKMEHFWWIIPLLIIWDVIFAVKKRIRGKPVIRENLISARWWCAETPDSTPSLSLSILSDIPRKKPKEHKLSGAMHQRHMHNLISITWKQGKKLWELLQQQHNKPNISWGDQRAAVEKGIQTTGPQPTAGEWSPILTMSTTMF